VTDLAAVDAWRPRYQEWAEFAQDLIQAGKPNDAWAKYPWFQPGGDVPFARLDKPASEARFGLVTTGGYSVEGEQDPVSPALRFDDTTPDLRLIPMDVDRSKLVIHHSGYDHRFAKEDVNVNLPLDRLSELASAGEVGSLAKETPVLMGLQPNVEPLLRDTIPEIVERFRSDSVEAALLVPS
jgi:D-proline reductase (dithiol) PrdB